MEPKYFKIYYFNCQLKMILTFNMFFLNDEPGLLRLMNYMLGQFGGWFVKNDTF